MNHLTNLVFLTIFMCAQCAKILGVFPMPAYSHFTLGFVLMKELADRGHEVTMISPYPQKNPIKNYRDIDLSSNIKIMNEKFIVHYQHIHKMGYMEEVMFFYSIGYTFMNVTFSNKNFQKFMNSNEKFDVIIVEQFLSEAMLYLPYHFKSPVLLFSSCGASTLTNHYFKNPSPYSYAPFLFLFNGTQTNIAQRRYNMLISLFDEFYLNFVVWPKHDEILHEFYPKAPPFKDLKKQVNIILINSHYSVNEPLPLTPNTIEIGGFHVKPTSKLPKDIQEFLDNSTNGVVYFCFGSLLKPSQFSQEKLDMFVRSFAKLKQNVLWKFEADALPNKPKNVKLVKWAPQQDILAHKNVKVFITHGGMLGSIEAVYFGVPIIGIPFYGDQKLNIATAVRKGHGIMIHHNELTEEKLSLALNEILTNKKYSKVAKVLSSAMRDRVVKPLDEAVYWVEYTINHPNQSYFKSVAVELNWFQYHMLDVLFVDLAALFIAVKLILWTYFYLRKQIKHTKIE